MEKRAVLLCTAASVSTLLAVCVARSFPLGSITPPPAGQALNLSVQFDSPHALEGWVEKSFRERTRYNIAAGPDGGKALHAESRKSSSGLFKPAGLSVSRRPVLSWEWRVETFPGNKKHDLLAAKDENDFAARIYVLFEGSLPGVPHAIQYVWDEHFKEGEHAESPYGKSAKVLVVESGPAGPQPWVREERDLVKDYELLFGKPPSRDLKAIGFMTDSDNTGTEARAYYRQISLKALAEEAPKRDPAPLALWKGVKGQLDRVGLPFQHAGQFLREKAKLVKKNGTPALDAG